MKHRSLAATVITALLAVGLGFVTLIWLAGRGSVDGVEARDALARDARQVDAELVAEAAVGRALDVGEVPNGARTPVAPAAVSKPDPRAAAAFHGRVLDVATGEPIAGVGVALEGVLSLPPRDFVRPAPKPFVWGMAPRSEAVSVDGRGRFAFDEPLPAAATGVAVLNLSQGTHVRTIRIEDLVADPLGGWLVQLAIGPTFRFDPLGIAGFAPGEWRARLVEVALDGVEHEGSWIRIRPTGGAPFLRYDNPWEPNLAGSRFRLDLRRESGPEAGSSALLAGPAVGIHPDVVPIALDRLQVVLTGRVVDTTGAPKQHVTVSAVPLGASVGDGPLRRTLEQGTEHDGHFAIAGLALGSVLLTARPRRGEPPATRRVLLDTAEVDIGDLVVARQEGAGMVTGMLVSAAGLPLANPEYVRLRSLDRRGIELFDTSSPLGDRHVFEFNEVPAGELELSVVSQGGHRWEPQTIRVTAPNDEVMFVRRDDLPLDAYAFEVLSASDGTPIHGYEARITAANGFTHTVRAGRDGGRGDLETRIDAFLDERELPAWMRAFQVPHGAPFTWTVSAPGYRTATGDEKAFAKRVEDEVLTLRESAHGTEVRTTHVATLRLRPGFAARLRFRDFGVGHGHDDDFGRVHESEAPRVPGVRLLADGEPVSTSTSDGDAWIELDAEPRRLEFEAPGWRLVESDAFRKGRIVGPARDVVIWMVHE